MALIGLNKQESLGYFSPRAQPDWMILNRISQGETSDSILCLEAREDLLFAGTLVHGLWQNSCKNNVQSWEGWKKVAEAQIDEGVSVLALSYHRDTLFVGTTAGLFSLQWPVPAAGLIWEPILPDKSGGPVAAPLISSVRATDSHLLVGTSEHGLWVRARDGDIWHNHPIDF